MGITRRGPPTAIISELKSTYNIPNFVETGTFLGDTAYWASKNFQYVFTVEFSDTIYQQAIQKYGSVGNITFLYGHTREKLKEIVSRIETPAVFWLDAHWSGDQTYGELDECPVLDEIDIINQFRNDSFIFIDDARLFLSSPPQPHRADQWPDITAVLSALNAGESRYIVVIEDVIIAVPEFAKPHMIRSCQEINTAIWHERIKRVQKSGWKKRAECIYHRMTAGFRK